MARPQKKGLQYFPLDVDAFGSDEFRLIQAEFGNNGVLVVLHVFCKIYKENGYYYKWGDDQCLLLSAGAGVVSTFVQEVLGGCFRRSIFDKGVFEMFGVITSHGIQMRYFEVAKKSKLSNVDIQEDFLLLNEDEINGFSSIFDKSKSGINPSKSGINSDKLINSELTSINSELTRVNPELTTQIKEKKIELNNYYNNACETGDFFQKNKHLGEPVHSHGRCNVEKLKQELLSKAWLEQVCVGQNVKMDELRPFVEEYISMREIRGDVEMYNLSQHKLFAVKNFNKSKADEKKNTQTVSNRPAASIQRHESVLEHNKRVFEELRGECTTETV